MKAIVWETGDIASNKTEAIKKAGWYLEKNPWADVVTICKYDENFTYWFEVGRENIHHAMNFVKI